MYKENALRRTGILQEGLTMKRFANSNIPYQHSVKTRIEAEGKIIGYLEGGCFRNYECPTKVFAEHAFEIQRGNFEPQLALTLNHWEVKNNGHHQLGLWGGGDDGR